MAVGSVGAGDMAGTIMDGILHAGIHPAQDMIVFDINEEKRSVFQQRGLRIAASVSGVVRDADVVFLAVKPQNFAEVLEEAKKAVAEQTRFVTIAAGISIHYTTSTLGCDRLVIHVMLNTLLLVDRGAAALCRSERVSDGDFAFMCFIPEACGMVEILQEDQINVATSASGNGLAYVYLSTKAAVESADRQGIPADAALRLFSQTLIGSAGMFLHSGHMPDELIKMVPSPDGTALEALDVFYSRGFEAIIDGVMLACTHRAEEFGK